jgi:hypothetical protein
MVGNLHAPVYILPAESDDNFQIATRRPFLPDKMEAHSTASFSTRVSLTQVLVQAKPRDKQEEVGWPQNYFAQCSFWFYRRKNISQGQINLCKVT